MRGRPSLKKVVYSPIKSKIIFFLFFIILTYINMVVLVVWGRFLDPFFLSLKHCPEDMWCVFLCMPQIGRGGFG